MPPESDSPFPPRDPDASFPPDPDASFPLNPDAAPPNTPLDLRQKGFKSGAAEYIGRLLNLDQRLITNRPASFFWRVRGDEARILGLKHGDLLLVDRSLPPRHGRLAVCVINRKFYIRRLRRFGAVLVPARLKTGDASDPFEVPEIWGVIRAVIREFPSR